MHVLFPINAPRVNAEGARDALGHGSDDEQLLAEDERSLFTARITPAPELALGDAVEFVVNTARLQFFDPTNGLALRTRERALSVAG
jgi:hypothetical protein